MGMSKHTPGPWFVHDRSEGNKAYHTITATEDQNGWTGDRYMSVSGCIDIHDARLIAAAPDMLEALRKSLSALERYECEVAGEGETPVAHRDMMEFVRSTIAAATGEAS